MSVSSRDVDKETGKPKDHVIDNDDDKKYIRLYRIEASREFILLSMFLLIGLGFMAWNPLQANLNTDKILVNQDINGKKLTTLLTEQREKETDEGLEIVKLLVLFDLDQERDINKIMEKLNIPNEHYVDVNVTHAITEAGSFKLPYSINASSIFHTGNDNFNRSNTTN